MSIELEILMIATLSSNAFGWKSDIAGFIEIDIDGIFYKYNEVGFQSRRCKSEDEYVEAIFQYVGLLDSLVNDKIEKFRSKKVQEFNRRAQNCNIKKLEQLVREYYRKIILSNTDE